jgi:predicted naringenin-chalcone synthase
MVRLAGIGTAYPPAAVQRDLWDGFFANHYAGTHRALAARLFANAGVTTRHAAVNPMIEDATGWSTARRMARYQLEAAPLGKEAIGAALDVAGVDAAEIGMFVVCSCTGYAAPGLDVRLATDLGMGRDTRRMVIGHMGCYAALPGLGAAADRVAVSGRPALLLCVELTTLHVQPPSRDPQQIVVHALFSDAAAAAVLLPGRGRYPVCEVASVTDSRFADYMTWDITGAGFRMGLSPKVPDVLAMHVSDLVTGLLDRHGMTLSDVDGWAVHPGGPRILDVVADRLGLTGEAMAASRGTLAGHGNCSSPTVLMIMQRLVDQPGGAPEVIVALAFGPGLTLYAALLGGPDGG